MGLEVVTNTPRVKESVKKWIMKKPVQKKRLSKKETSKEATPLCQSIDTFGKANSVAKQQVGVVGFLSHPNKYMVCRKFQC